MSNLHLISANDLRSGLNVYFINDNGNSSWDTDAQKASLFNDETVKNAFELAREDIKNNIVVDCVIVDVDEDRNPITTREQIRAAGPSSKFGK